MRAIVFARRGALALIDRPEPAGFGNRLGRGLVGRPGNRRLVGNCQVLFVKIFRGIFKFKALSVSFIALFVTSGLIRFL